MFGCGADRKKTKTTGESKKRKLNRSALQKLNV